MQNAVFGVDVEASTETSVISKFFRKNVRKLRYFSDVAVKKSRHEKYLFLISFFKSRHEEYFCGSCFFKSGH